MSYIPNAEDTAEPVESRSVESAALEFRTLKTLVTGLQSSTAGEIARLDAADAAEIAARVEGDTAIINMVSPYISKLASLEFFGISDLGFVYDSVIYGTQDLGTL
jgi:hypothetical protein